MKKLSKTILPLLLAFSLALTACGTKAQPEATPTPAATPAAPAPTKEAETKATSDEKIKISILQGLEHDALTASREGFIAALAAAGYVEGEKITIDYKNGQNDQSNLTTISEKFANDKPNLILTIGTQASVSMAAATKDIPILITAVTDPKAAGLVVDVNKPDTNVTGTSDFTSVDQQIDLMMKIVPTAKKLALLYTSSEENSILQAKAAEAYAKTVGLEVEHKTVTSVNDIAQVTESLVGKFDMIYIPTDNTLAAAMATIATITVPNKIPVFPAEEGMVKSGGLASISISYYDLGYKTGEMAVQILEGKAKPQDMPIQYIENPSMVINSAIMKEMGITIPEDILSQARMLNEVN